MSAPAADLLTVRDLHAGYGKAEVLAGLSLRAAAGSVVTVIGPNGAGKSTMLNAIMGVLPARGALLFDGADMARDSLEQRVLRGVALVPERRELFGSMPVEDNLILGAFRRFRLRQPDWRSELDKVYALFPRLQERRTQLAGTLSGGERQMLAIGRALMSRPRLLLLDEPSLGLAPLMVERIFGVVRELKRQGSTMLLVEQNVHHALDIADRAYVIETGRVTLDGPAAELKHNPIVEQSYLGR